MIYSSIDHIIISIHNIFSLTIYFQVDNFHTRITGSPSSSSTAIKRPKLEESDIGHHTSFQNISQYILQSNTPTDIAATKVDPQSTRNLYANLSLFLGPNNLCKPFTEFGKAAVVTAANNGIPPKFSKYSGVLEWKNCVFLWVNLGPGLASSNGSGMDDEIGSVGGRKGSVELTYDNTFLNEGRSFVWFGGNKMTIGKLYVLYELIIVLLVFALLLTTLLLSYLFLCAYI